MSDYPMGSAVQIAAEVLDLHEKGQTLEGEAWDKNAEAYKAKCIASAAILAVKLQDALANIDAVHAAFGAPGDYGYETPKGRALYALYRLLIRLSPKGGLK